MIRYALTCANAHSFESWFKSAEGFDTLVGAGMVTCSVCGSSEVSKSLMAPSVRPGRKVAAEPDPAPDLSKPGSKVEAALAEMRRQIEENSDYVGMNFAAEARAMHLGDSPARSIWGETRADEARKLIEDGIPVAPLPFVPRRKAN